MFKLLKLIISFILFASFLFFFLKINLWDYDYWWHIATGKYIVTEGHLPEKDPFSFTSTMEENKNLFPEWENFLLKQYWLAEILFYIIFDYAGPKGIIFLRSILLVLTLLIVYWHLQKSGVSFHISFISVFLLFTISTRYLGERPVLFSFLFTAVVLFLLENFKNKKDKNLFLLVPLMLLWSNMHGGFIIGDIIIMVFMFGEVLKIIFKKSNYTKKEKKIFYTASGMAIIISFINPIGWDSFFIAFSHKYDIFLENIQEWESPFTFYTQKLRPFDYSYAISFLMFPLILLLRNRKLDLNHIMLLSGFFYMSMTASRFIFFYAIVATMIIAREFDILINDLIRKKGSAELHKKIEYALAVAALCSVLLFMSGYFKYEQLKFKIAKGSSVPEAAVTFIEENKIEGNMFNDYGYGGYIAWRLYPWKKNFIDTRSLNITVMTEYGWIINATESAKEVKPSISNTPLWERLLNHYKINFVILSPLDIYGQATPLTFILIENDKWVPVYRDPISVIFVRNTVQNRAIIEEFKLSKEDVYNTIIYQGAKHALSNRLNPRSFVSLGETFYKMGRLNDAITAYQYALKRMPGSPHIKEKLAQLEFEQNSGGNIRISDEK